MSGGSYKTIFILLSVCILFVLGVQAYWIRNFYLQKKEEFDRTVYATLDQLEEKLRERRKLNAVKMTYFIQNGDTLVRTPSRNMTIVSEDKVEIINNNGNVQTKEIISLKKTGKGKQGKDTVLITGKNERVNIVLNGRKAKVRAVDKKKSIEDLLKESGDLISDSKEMTKLLDKMMTEIKVLDTEVEAVDSLHNLIKRSLDNKGLFLPFEFAVQKQQDGKDTVLSQSQGFKKEAPFYKSDLSANSIFPNHQFLLLQFPDQNDFVMAGMRDSLILSLIFSLLILGVFYYVMRLILNQKNLSEVKNDFVNNMTHELKTPIATISLALDAINTPLVKNDEEKFREYGRILKEENQKLNQHVERVLQIALLDKGKLQLNQKKLDLEALLKEAVESYKLQVTEQNAEIHFEPGPDPVFITGDAHYLKTVFGNLLDNALKYSQGSCKLEITLYADENQVRIHFKDNGIGMDAADHKKVFEKFYRVQGGNLHDVKGFGLGLSYVKSAVEAHGGTVELQSVKGKGSTFIITFKGARI